MDSSNNNIICHQTSRFVLALEEPKIIHPIVIKIKILPKIKIVSPAGPSSQNLPVYPTQLQSSANGRVLKKKIVPPYSIQIGPKKFPLLIKMREEFPEGSQDENTKITSWLMIDRVTPDKNK